MAILKKKKRNISLKNYRCFLRDQTLLCHCRKHPYDTAALCNTSVQFRGKLYHSRRYFASKSTSQSYFSHIV